MKDVNIFPQTVCCRATENESTSEHNMGYLLSCTPEKHLMAPRLTKKCCYVSFTTQYFSYYIKNIKKIENNSDLQNEGIKV